MPKFYRKEIKLWATQIPIKELMEKLGEPFEKSGKEYRWIGDHSSLTFKNNLWYHHATQRGGNSISFLTTFCNMNCEQAMTYLTQEFDINQEYKEYDYEEPNKPFVIPQISNDCKRMYAYLCKTRHIDSKVINSFYRSRLIYQDKPFNNVVFAGYDEAKHLVFAHKKGTMKGKDGKVFQQTVEGSNWNYGFRWEGTSEHVYIFEAPIDMLAYISMNQDGWQQHSYLALCGLSTKSLIPFLQRKKGINILHFCVDHDIAGSFGINRMIFEIKQKGCYRYCYETPKNKDWDEDLKEQYGEQPVKAIENVYPLILKRKFDTLNEKIAELASSVQIMDQYLKVCVQRKSGKDNELNHSLMKLALLTIGYISNELKIDKEDILSRVKRTDKYCCWQRYIDSAYKELDEIIQELKIYIISQPRDKPKEQAYKDLLFNLCEICLNAAAVLEFEKKYPRQTNKERSVRDEQTCQIQSM